MARSSQPSPPRPEEPSVRRLSHSSTSGERPIRAQAVVAFSVVLVLVAVPLYLLRRPGGGSFVAPPDNRAHGFGGVIRAEMDASTEVSDVLLGPLQRVRCGSSPTQTSGEGGLCDPLPLLDTALREAIVQNPSCAPRADKEGSINYVLEVDFAQNRLNMFAGKSGTWRGPSAKKAATCLLRALPPMPWTELPHQHPYYAIAILATYPAGESSEALPNFD